MRVRTGCQLGFLFEFVRKNESKRGSQLKLSNNEMKGLKKYKESYKEDVAEMNRAIHESVVYYKREVYQEVR